MKRTSAFRRLGYSTLTDFAERALNLSGRKTGQLLGAAEALEHLPLLSEAYRKGDIGWGKVRAIHGLATPETEEEWLKFAVAHSTTDVARRVSISPQDWKRHQALKASLKGTPTATVAKVKEVLARPILESSGSAVSPQASSSAGDDCLGKQPTADGAQDASPAASRAAGPVSSASKSAPTATSAASITRPAALPSALDEPISPATRPPALPKKVRFVVEMDADDYAVFAQAETRIRARAGRRLSRGKVLVKMAESVLNQGTARARARHQVIIHTVEDVEGGWYETDRGVLPASAEVVEEALRTGNVVRAEELSQPAASNVETRESQDFGGRRSKRRETNPRGDSDTPPAQPDRQDRGNTSHADTDASPRGDCRTPSRHPGQPTATRKNIVQTDPGPKPPGDSATRSPDRQSQRKPVPNGTIRRLYARAGKRCERCGTSGCGLHIHHKTPISEGGNNELKTLELLCSGCHSLIHQADFEQKPHWRKARETALSRKATTGASHCGMSSPSGPHRR